MRTVKIAFPILLLALLAPATASAQTPPPDERAAAQAMADAAKRAVEDATAMFPGDGPSRPCKPMLTIPSRHEDDGFTVLLGLSIRQGAPVIAPRMRELRTELANVQTTDPALIAGRAAWRRWGRALETIEAYRGSLCAAIRRWRKAGYPRSTVRDAERALATYFPGRGAMRRMKAAVRRMVELGVPREDAKSFDPFSS